MEQNKFTNVDNSENNNPKNTESKEEKIFSQKELDEIIKIRLDRANKKHLEEIEKIKNNQGQENEEKAKELKEKELMLECKSYLIDNKLPLEYLKVINTQDIEEFKNKIDILVNIEPKEDEIVAPLKSVEGSSYSDYLIDKGFLNSDHEPKKLYSKNLY